ncbi:MAG TPA: hypothetical protein VFH80_16680 [Solirubrobacteraceae bacterium]|nr:hypothetical protein [Solirubrobacteraceae bacterium]
MPLRELNQRIAVNVLYVATLPMAIGEHERHRRCRPSGASFTRHRTLDDAAIAYLGEPGGVIPTSG